MFGNFIRSMQFLFRRIRKEKTRVMVMVITGNFAFLGKHQSVQKRGLMVRSDTGKKKTNTYILILFVLWS